MDKKPSRLLAKFSAKLSGKGRGEISTTASLGSNLNTALTLIPRPRIDLQVSGDDETNSTFSPRTSVQKDSTERRRTPNTSRISRQARNARRRRHWKRCDAGPGIDQVNCFAVEVHAGQKRKLELKPIKGSYTYSDCKKVGKGVQINGPDVIDLSATHQPAIPEFHGTWNGCTFQPDPLDDSEHQGLQVNGGRFSVAKDFDFMEPEI
ncbi:hypothetical protein G7Z17_g3565 [Cylindrodendrum hubeiense]|uniref:Uncharacterized protein n=1 Tax=Cylindrodendrum hubeiense TaxID=595255 RepID=A0A9P5HHR4_9HYPO|nr:hypothetical protein G7Z17_g3565 [Cylindrodendrum hubeiense]